MNLIKLQGECHIITPPPKKCEILNVYKKKLSTDFQNCLLTYSEVCCITIKFSAY